MDQNLGENSQHALEAIDERMQTLFETSKAYRVLFEFFNDEYICKCGKVLSDKNPAKRLADEAALFCDDCALTSFPSRMLLTQYEFKKCPICLGSDNLHYTSCGHAICGSCWVPYCTWWHFTQSLTTLSISNPKCPLCRKEMEPRLIPATKPAVPLEVETNVFDFAIQ